MVCLTVTTVIPAKMAEPLDEPFGLWPTEPCIRWGLDPDTRMGNFEGERDQPRTCRDMSEGRYTQSDSAGGSAGRVRMLIWMYYMECTLAQPDEYD